MLIMHEYSYIRRTGGDPCGRGASVTAFCCFLVTGVGTDQRLPKDQNSIMCRYEELKDHGPSVDDVHDVAIELTGTSLVMSAPR